MVKSYQKNLILKNHYFLTIKYQFECQLAVANQVHKITVYGLKNRIDKPFLKQLAKANRTGVGLHS